MRKLLTTVISLVLAAVLAAPAAAQFLPYEVKKRTLPNGLDVLVVETPEFKDVVNVNTLILAGSRNEIEKGRSGLAHLFEHIAFRHKFEDPENSYTTRIDQIGAFDNAWTWFDVTYYHPVTFRENLERLIALQAERFVAMEFSERIYRTEAGAVLGEYRRNASDPSLRVEEVLGDLAYGREHGYGHTTIGYLADVEDMPNSFRSGKAFYERYYIPQNAVVIVTGDVRAEEVFPLVEKYYGVWKRGPALPKLPAVPAMRGPKRGHVPWESDIPPRMTYAHIVGAFEPGTAESAVLNLMPQLIAGETAPLYQELRFQRQVATSMDVYLMPAQGFDPRPLEVGLRLDKDKFGAKSFAEVEQILDRGHEELKRFSQRADAATTLQALKSRYRYDLLAGLDSPGNIGQTLAWYYRFNRDPQVLDRIVASIDALQPADIDRFAAKYFVPARKVVVTVAPKGAAIQ